MKELKKTIERAWDERSLLSSPEVKKAIDAVIDALDKGKLRVAEPTGNGEWQVNEWVKKAVVMYFPMQQTADI